MSRTLLLIGIAMKELVSMVGPEKAAGMAEMIAAGIQRDLARFMEAGLAVDLLEVSADDSMSKVEAQLRKKFYDGVNIGYGLRSHKDFTPLFELLVDTVHTISPSSKLFFNTGPDNSLEAAKRWFPEIGTGVSA